jgi:hypothetical protein
MKSLWLLYTGPAEARWRPWQTRISSSFEKRWNLGGGNSATVFPAEYETDPASDSDGPGPAGDFPGPAESIKAT